MRKMKIFWKNYIPFLALETTSTLINYYLRDTFTHDALRVGEGRRPTTFLNGMFRTFKVWILKIQPHHAKKHNSNHFSILLKIDILCVEFLNCFTMKFDWLTDWLTDWWHGNASTRKCLKKRTHKTNLMSSSLIKKN